MFYQKLGFKSCKEIKKVKLQKKSTSAAAH